MSVRRPILSPAVDGSDFSEADDATDDDERDGGRRNCTMIAFGLIPAAFLLGIIFHSGLLARAPTVAQNLESQPSGAFTFEPQPQVTGEMKSSNLRVRSTSLDLPTTALSLDDFPDSPPLTPEQERCSRVNQVMPLAPMHYQDASEGNDDTNYTPSEDYSQASLITDIEETTTTKTTTTTEPAVSAACPQRQPIPPPPKVATDYNGISWPDMCFAGDDDEHVLIIGDWGGIMDYRSGFVKPAPNHKGKRDFVYGLDDKAQKLVAAQMSILAAKTKPRYVLNAGDNFYWCGLGCTGHWKKSFCGQDMNESVTNFHTKPWYDTTKQYKKIFEEMYTGPGLDNIPWLSCLGNHDYGGFQFNLAWDQQIAYTWGPSGRWVLPGQYYHQHISYPTKNFTVDVYGVDTNNQDTTHPNEDPMHNICSAAHNGLSNCAPFGPSSTWDCVDYFKKLWQKQLVWLEEMLAKSTADWQIVVTHFPPETWTHYGKNVEDWKKLGEKYGIDLMVCAHRHQQEVRSYGDPMVKYRSQIPFVVSGGGGGVTSEGYPTNGGGSGADQYGFFDMILTKEKLSIQGYNHNGWRTRYMEVIPKHKECSVTDGSGPSSHYPCGCGIAANGAPNSCVDTGGPFGRQWCRPGFNGRYSWGDRSTYKYCAPSPTPSPTPAPTPDPTAAPTEPPTPTPTRPPLAPGETYAPTVVPTPTPTSAPTAEPCDTPWNCGTAQCSPEQYACFKEVQWAKDIGSRQHPDWYVDSGCNQHSDFECFQGHIHKINPSVCPKPCERDAR